MTRVTVSGWLVVAAMAACTPSLVVHPAPRTSSASVDELVRLRCSHDGNEVFTTWTGDVYAVVPGEPQRHLFAVVGMNVARCLRQGERWQLTSRELLYYLDPASRTRLDRWTSPWTDRTVTVVHVANERVQTSFTRAVPSVIADELATVAFDIPLFYPNPLAADPETQPFSPFASYQAAELFTFAAPAAELLDPARPTVSRLWFTWHRLGPWLPWMDMGDRPGQLVYSARGRKVSGFDELPALLREDISTRLPRYRHAATCIVARPNETSWTYFGRHLDAYRAGARFPLPAAFDPTECP